MACFELTEHTEIRISVPPSGRKEKILTRSNKGKLLMALRLRALIKLIVAVTLVIGAQQTAVMGDKLLSVDYEVFGIVQGVFFRKNTVMKGTQLGLRGWCMNTSQGTVRGQMEGPQKEIDQMKHWLQYTGSPMSRIDKAVFTNEKDIDKYSFDKFSVRH